MACKAVAAPDNALNSGARKISARRLARTVKDKFKPVPHSKAFVKKALARRGVKEAYQALAPEYRLVAELLRARKAKA